ncbi:GDSL esterase/lipase EXL3-like [Phaseolus vulgaris]
MMMMMNLSTLKSLIACLFVVLLYIFDVTAKSQTNYSKFAFPAVIAFGDSVLDTGNNDYIATIMKADFRPYGRDFLGGKATGRFSNGRIPSDFLAEIFGIKESLPPYLDPNLEIEDLLTGVSFASAGSGYDPLTTELAAVLSAQDQLNMFRDYIGKLKADVGEERTAFILAKSIFFISMGSNDILVTYFMSPFRRNEYNVEEYTSMLVDISSNFLQELYKYGARKIGVLSLAPIGCVPLQRTLRGGEERNCVESVNQAAMVYNSKLSSSVVALSKSLPKARLVYLDNYSELSEFIQHHKKFGFEVENSGCCGIANIEAGFLCNSFSLGVCQNATKYVFWDSIHPTERTYSMLVTDIVEKNIHKFV